MSGRGRRERNKAAAKWRAAGAPELDAHSLTVIRQHLTTCMASRQFAAAVKELRAYAESARVQEYGCELVTRQHGDTVVLMAAAGGVEVMVAALRRFGEDPRMAHLACGALANLTDTRNVVVGANGVEAVLYALSAHGETDAEVARRGCELIANLLANAEDRDAIATAGGCELMVLTCLRAHRGVDAVVGETCSALIGLTADAGSRQVITSAGGIELVVKHALEWILCNAGVGGTADAALRDAAVATRATVGNTAECRRVDPLVAETLDEAEDRGGGAHGVEFGTKDWASDYVEPLGEIPGKCSIGGIEEVGMLAGELVSPEQVRDSPTGLVRPIARAEEGVGRAEGDCGEEATTDDGVGRLDKLLEEGDRSKATVGFREVRDGEAGEKGWRIPSDNDVLD